MRDLPRDPSRQPKMEGASEDEAVRVLRKDIHVQEGQREDVWSLLWEQIGVEVPRVAKGVAHRVDRLKALGNGQIPAVVRAAWSSLAIEPDNQ